ncbi:MAG TPA: hypothetical protein VF128_07560 [Gemmatimonadaceae bacterium]
MRSPDSTRALGEGILRGVSLVALVVLAIRFWMGTTTADVSTVVPSESLDSALVAWSVAAPAVATLNAATLPERRQRDWLVALRRGGSTVSWTTADSTGGVLVVEPGAIPAAATHITALGSPGGALVMADELGRIDSMTAGAGGVATWRANPIGAVRTTVNSAHPSAQARDSMMTGPVLVVGDAGWEAKFVTAALEEEGWSVAARVTVAPSTLVRQRATLPVDTSALSAIVVLDSTSALDVNAITRFVNEGGGLLAAGAGTRHPALRSLLPRTARTVDGAVGALLGPAPRDGLDARTFTVSAGVVPLERRRDSPVVVGRRMGSGRVVGIGYDDTWRLRMTPPDDAAPEAHRAWWSSLVAGVAHSRLTARADAPVDEAPLAATFDALGAPVNHSDLPARRAAFPWDAVLAAAAALALLLEWLSRRLRGVA